MKDLLQTITGAVTSKVFLWALGLALILGGTLVVISKNRDAKLVDTGREAGSAATVATGQAAILEQVERANDAEEEVARGGDAARYDRCLRNATADTRANCERFRPVPDRP